MKHKHSEQPAQQQKIEEISSEQTSSALLNLFLYSVLMFTLPFGAFFGTKYILGRCTKMADFTITSLSVTSAVITVYIIIGFYAHKAYAEEDIESSTERKLKKQ